MVKLFGMCLNWKVLLGVGVMGFGIWIIAPGLLWKVLPLLLVAVCPLSMLGMGWGMKRMMERNHHDSGMLHEGSPKPAQVDPQNRLADLEAKQAALQREIAQVKAETSQQTNTAH
jgi:hypothetical protein